MPITPKPFVATEPLSVCVPREVLELLDDYCRFLGGATDRTYVIVESIRHAITGDRRYRKTVEARKGSSTSANTPSPKTASGERT